MNILSVSAYNCNSSVVLCNNNKIVSAYYEQQFSRRRYDCSFPATAIAAAMQPHQSLDAILFSDATHYKRFCSDMRRFSAVKPQLVSTSDALAYAAAIPYAADSSAVIVVNAEDTKRCISLGYYNGISVSWLKHIQAPNCLYSLYTNVVRLLGLSSNKQAMFAARIGKPLWKRWAYENLISCSGSDLSIKTYSNSFGTAFLDHNVACSTQQIIQEIFIELAQWLHQHLNTSSLIFAGNFSDNSDLVTALYKHTDFTHIATSLDTTTSACSLGAVAAITQPLWESIYLGADCSNSLDADSAAFKILNGEIVPIIHGRTEFSTSSFGNRAFIAIPSEQNVSKLDNILGKPTWEPYKVVCQNKELPNFFEVIGDTRYAQASLPIIKSNYNTDYNTLEVQSVNMTTNAYINRILEKTRQHGFPFLLCADLRIQGKPIINSIEDYNNEIQLYNRDAGRHAA